MRILGRILREAVSENGNDLGGAGAETITNEEEALASLVGGDEQSQETITPEINAQTNEGEADNIDLSEVDLSFLGINSEAQEQQNETATQIPQEIKPNQMEEVLNKLNELSNPNAPQDAQMPQEEEDAVKDLFSKFQQLGLIPESNGLSEEQEARLKKLEDIESRLESEEKEKQEYAEHQTKLSDLDSFSKKLETTIPGYSTEFMQKVIGDINGTNPEAAQKIFNNPSLLIDLWNSVGAKAQPKNEPTGVINGNNQQTTQLSNLDEKVKNGTATEQEEAEWLLNS